ncbi:MAG: hypothetical protein ACK493_11240 [Planctomycetota bacterium]
MKRRLRMGTGFMTAKNLLVFSAVIALFCSVSAAVWAIDEPNFPYQAFALRDGTLVRSGPGAAHYATDELKQGQPVEVWRHDPDGWCAIRPTPDSFSLIPASAVEVLSADRCRVLQSGLQAWVGTRLGPVENPLWQVKLNAEEELTILGEVNWPSPEGSSLIWFQVAPPDGEFRWVKISDLQVPDQRTQLPVAEGTQNGTYIDRAVRPTGQFEELERPLEFAPQRSPSSSSANKRPASQTRDVIIDPFGDEEQAIAGPQPSRNDVSAGWRRARRPLNMAQNTLPGSTSQVPGQLMSGPQVPGSLDRPAGGSAPLASDLASQSPNGSSGNWAALERPAGRDLNAPVGSGLAGGPTAVSPVTPSAGLENMPAQLRQIDMDLSMEIVKPAGQWQFSRFVQRLNDAYSSAASTAERNQAQQLLAKIDRLKELQFSLTGKQSPDETRMANRGGPATIGNGIAANVEFGTTYDAYGWLSECVQESGRAPSTFVLQDDNGKIICQVTPAPGFNMHRYLKTKVGVIGQRGYNQKLNLNHVMVDRVVVLENPNTNLR